MAGDAQMAAHHIDEHRIALGRPDGGEMADRPDGETDQPEPQAEAKRRRQCAVEDGEATRRAALAGRMATPSVFDMMLLLGRDEVLARLDDQAA